MCASGWRHSVDPGFLLLRFVVIVVVVFFISPVDQFFFYFFFRAYIVTLLENEWVAVDAVMENFAPDVVFIDRFRLRVFPLLQFNVIAFSIAQKFI